MNYSKEINITPESEKEAIYTHVTKRDQRKSMNTHNLRSRNEEGKVQAIRGSESRISMNDENIKETS